ncbi:MAG TPA: phosphotransferase [Gemmataceae bacterium]|nr:phosphotransferase [Gemmataceae bacterium]
MSSSPPESDALAVLAHYPALARPGILTPLGNRGGFSGASLWRIDAPGGEFCLRAWPAHETWPRLRFRHALMREARQRGLHFVPSVLVTRDRATGIEHGGRLWELTEWLPGCADFHERPSPARLEAATIALAQLHIVWRGETSEASVCPAVQRRLKFFDEWQHLLHSGWRPLVAAHRDGLLFPLVEHAWHRLPTALEQVPHRLRRWLRFRCRLQPCLCDVWHDHLLFVDDRLRGVIDYGAAKVDHVAVDLARMLGSLVRNDAAGWQAGLQAYRRFAPLDPDEEELAHDLDETGVILGVANWLRWLYEEKRPFADHKAVAHRLAELVTRLESLC